VRRIAASIGLEKISQKPSSVGICFIGKRKFSEFISNYLIDKSGVVIDLETGQKIGEHTGIYHFTIGQKIPINDRYNTHKKSFFVAKKDPKENSLYVVRGTDHPALYHNTFYIEKPHWICEDKESTRNELVLDERYDFKFQHKHYQSGIKSLRRIKDLDKPIKYLVETKFNFRGITPGQVN